MTVSPSILRCSIVVAKAQRTVNRSSIKKREKNPKTSILSRTTRFWNNIQRHPHSQKTGKPNNLEKNAMKNEHICSMCIKINKVGKKEVGI